ncbi:hypothetical protein BDFB_009392 [Asbolus verrucosus]|nr:hypothetical protein BDFB_009392 [Asbolus verrucosus]
MESLKGR